MVSVNKKVFRPNCTVYQKDLAAHFYRVEKVRVVTCSFQSLDGKINIEIIIIIIII